ncbi:hypothetical protein [Hymenobacter radiodurans]|uniref:hypothetical protein n=1 Tax=Hymenobacter radiodurans TaxID=2496028 RepID=UPI0014053A93|nr:hypothetical protein [Hymenobacter radiodurans]
MRIPAMSHHVNPSHMLPAPGTRRLLIKNMVCPQCIRVVREDLSALGCRCTTWPWARPT